MFHILYRDGTTEVAIMVNFGINLKSHLPLGTEEKLANPDFPIPISFIYGDNDWVYHFVDQDYAKTCVEANK